MKNCMHSICQLYVDANDLLLGYKTNAKGRTVTQTFRIEREAYSALVSESELDGTSLNVLLNRILVRFAKWDRFQPRQRTICFVQYMFKELLEKVDDDDLQKLGDKDGSENVIRYLNILGAHEHLSPQLFILRHLSNYANWFEMDQYDLGDSHRVHLTHMLGKKWSTYLQAMILSLARTVRTALDLTATDDTITFTLNSKPVTLTSTFGR